MRPAIGSCVGNPLIIPMIIQTIPLDPSGAVQVDAEHRLAFGRSQSGVSPLQPDRRVILRAQLSRPLSTWSATLLKGHGR